MPPTPRPTPDAHTPPGVLALAAIAACAALAGALGAPPPLLVFVVIASALVSGLLLFRRWIAADAALRQVEQAAAMLARAAEVSGVTDAPELAAALVRRHAAAEARARDLTDLLDAVPDPVLLTDRSGRVEWHNAEAARVLGPMLAVGAPLEELFAQPEPAEAVAAAGVARPDIERLGIARPVTSSIRVVIDGDLRTFELTASAVPVHAPDIPSDTGARVALTLRDITEMATASQFKTDFVANASHELRTPIASIRTAAETLRTLADDPPMHARVLGMIEQNALRLEEMVRDLLDLSRLESPVGSPEVREFGLGQIESALRPMFEPLCAPRGLSLMFHVEQGAERVRTDPKILQLVLRNLIDNSVKFAYSGTTIVVRARAEDGGELVLTVTDRGEGIPLAHQQRIFERFYQVDTARTGGVRRGTGLGLAIVKHAARALGGSVSVRSVYKEGSEFTVRVPGAVGAEAARGASGGAPDP